MRNKRYIVYQPVIIREEVVNDKTIVEMETIIRNVGGVNKEEALGKYILSIDLKNYIRCLNPRVLELEDLIKIN